MHVSSDISAFWLLPWLAICVIAVWYFYRNNSWFNGLSVLMRWVLRSLRVAILFIVGILLFGFMLQTKSFRSEKPVVVLLSDRSASMLNYKDSSLVPEQLNSLRTAIKDQLSEKFDLVEMSVGTDAKYEDQVAFEDGNSALSLGFSKINVDYYNRNVGAVLFVSDGNFNKGSHPVYEAEKINFTPVYSLIVGDTVPKRDHYVKNVGVNDVAFLKNKFPVEVDLEGIKMGKGTTSVSVVQNGKVLATQTVTYKDGKRDFEHVSFLIDANKVGFQSYAVVIQRESNESNYENNIRNFYVEILDARSKILILSGAPHPDISAFVESLGTDQNLEVVSVLTKDWDRNLKNVNLVIWHEPGINFNPEILDVIKQRSLPLLYCIGPNTGSGVVGKLGIGLQVSGSNQFDETQGKWNDAFSNFELSPELKRSIEFYPPLKTKFGEVGLTGGLDVAIFQRVGPVTKKDPLVFFGQRDQQKFGVIFGEGIWKWRMNEFLRTKSFDGFNELIHKLTQYLLVKQNSSNLHVQFPKRFTKDEEVIVNATVYNESLEKITSPKVKMTVKTENGRVFNRDFARTSDMYRLSLGRLAPGKYSWSASTSFNGKSFRKSGEFVVEDVALEKLTSSSNGQVMQQLATRTDGTFHFLKDYQKTLDELMKRDDITSVSYAETTFNDLIDLKWLFFLLLVLLTAEWFLRKWMGAY